MPMIDGQRVVADLKRLAEFGRYKTGVHRPTYSPVDVESRHWLADKLREAGLDTRIDGIGNVIGRNPSARRRLLVGSHSETQPYGGWLDGSLGVIYGLELARVFAEDPDCAELGIEVAAWADEEGHYGNFLGSRSFTDTLPDEEIDRIRGRDDGTPLREALERAGFAGRPRERVEGKILERAGGQALVGLGQRQAVRGARDIVAAALAHVIHLAPQDVKILRGGRYIADLDIFLGAGLEKSFEPPG